MATVAKNSGTAAVKKSKPKYSPATLAKRRAIATRDRQIVAAAKAGETLTRANVRSIRPGNGLAPAHLDEVLGRPAVRDLTRGEPLAWDMLG